MQFSNFEKNHGPWFMAIRFANVWAPYRMAHTFFWNSRIKLLLRKMKHTKVILMTDLKIGTLVFNHSSKKIVYRVQRITCILRHATEKSHSFQTLCRFQQSYSRDMLPGLIFSCTDTGSNCFLYFHQRINFQKISVHQVFHRDDNLKLLG